MSTPVYTAGLIIFLFLLIVDILALCGDLVLLNYYQTSITDQFRKYAVLALLGIAWQQALPLALVMHLYM